LEFKAYTPCRSNRAEIRFRDPSIPVVLKLAQGRVVVLILTKRPFVDNTRIARVIE
jgi:hypothetical protein